MNSEAKDPILEQRRYYTETATRYDSMHAHEGVDDDATMRILFSVLRTLGVHSLLDVGSATGRGLPRLAEGLPNALVCGVEPVEALVRQGVSSGVTQGLPLLMASGDALPFADHSFDAVCEFAMLHHVPDPARVVQEMLRVARNVLVIADSNRLGQGSFPLRIIKLLLYKLKLWKAFDFVRTRARGYQVSEGDGVFYSYSAFDNLHQLQQWAESVYLFPLDKAGIPGWFHPLLTSGSVLLIAVRKQQSPAP